MQSNSSVSDDHHVHGHSHSHKAEPINIIVKGFIPCTEDMLIGLFKNPAINAIQFPNFYINVYNCIQATNVLIDAIQGKKANFAQEVIEFLSEPVQRNNTYCTGNIRMKEAHTYTYEGKMGPIQIGIPPETIKASMRKGENVPKVYVLPASIFTGSENYGEVEFPIYFNFFIKKAFLNRENRIILIGSERDLERIRTIFSESFYGPAPQYLYIDEEISPKKKATGYRIDFSKERDEIAAKAPDGSPTPISDFANFMPFDKDGVAEFSQKLEDGTEVVIKIVSHSGFYQIFEDGKKTASVDTNITPHVHKCTDLSGKRIKIGEDDHEPLNSEFEPPTLGVTFIGTSHGFDAKGHTTGFIIWINGAGILVDPPPITTEYLRSNGIPASLVQKCILTHCHSDHDSGLLRKILDGEKIELYTTRTINESYQRKMNAVTGLNIGDFYDFVPVPIGESIKILGASFEFDYAFHTIPCVRFKLFYGKKSISYSADTHYNPELYSKMRAKGSLNLDREMSLNMFIFDADLIIHESGVPPIHTTIAQLNDLPISIKKKMVIVHCSSIPTTVEKETPEGKMTIPVKNLRIPPSGLFNSIVLDVGQYMEGISAANKKIKMFTDTFLFKKLSPNAIYDLYITAEELVVEAGQVVVSAGEESDRFFIIYSGSLDVYKNDIQSEIIAVLYRGDVFGESALRKNKFVPRTATVSARTRSILFSISTKAFHNIVNRDQPIERTRDFETDLARLAKMRPFVKTVLAKTYLFQNLTEDQSNFIAASLETEQFYEKGSYIIHEGDTDRSLFLIEKGTVRLERNDTDGNPQILMTISAGEMFGELSLLTSLPRTASAIANEDTVLFELKEDAFEGLIKQFQNLRVKLALLVEQRLKETMKVNLELSPLRRTLLKKEEEKKDLVQSN
eukprot:TRINITY_DN1227_c0_g1_i1.p1 TRINITY_DN1227_c0_g1~~TRINITY_DN1227_c0_g1_i1.p1  ORF type:complete len:1049 (-),score=230.27 TRINITY_DN1227_c0_g1_i1:34-2751(-)